MGCHNDFEHLLGSIEAISAVHIRWRHALDHVRRRASYVTRLRQVDVLVRVTALGVVGRQTPIPDQLRLALAVQGVDVFDKGRAHEHLQAHRRLIINFDHDFVLALCCGKVQPHALRVGARKMNNIGGCNLDNRPEGHEALQARVAEAPACHSFAYMHVNHRVSRRKERRSIDSEPQVQEQEKTCADAPKWGCGVTVVHAAVEQVRVSVA